MKNVELRHLHRVLVHVGGNRNKAAGILGISRTTMYRILEEEKKSWGFGERISGSATQIVAS